MKTKRFFSLALVAVLGAGSPGFAQGMFSRPKDSGEQLAKVFGKNAAFTANADVTIKDKGGKTLHSMEFIYAVLDGKVRTEMDMTKMRSSQMPPNAAAQMKQMGMDRVINIYLPDENMAYMIYPGLNAYCEVPTALASGKKSGEKVDIEKTELGMETVDGHPCVKSKAVVTDATGRKTEMTLWQATDLKDLPIQIAMDDGSGGTILTHFRDIDQTKPKAALFKPDASFKRFGSMQEMMMSSMQRMMPPGGMPSRDN